MSRLNNDLMSGLSDNSRLIDDLLFRLSDDLFPRLSDDLVSGLNFDLLSGLNNDLMTRLSDELGLNFDLLSRLNNDFMTTLSNDLLSAIVWTQLSGRSIPSIEQRETDCYITCPSYPVAVSSSTNR